MCGKRISGLWGWIIFVVIAVLISSVTASAKVIYVDADATGTDDGSSWANAYNNLTVALGAAQSGDEIRVAQGVYKPTEYVQPPPPPPPPPPPLENSKELQVTQEAEDRTLTFQLVNGAAMRGGFAGFGEPDPNARDIQVYETILSGDIGIVGYYWDNCYHVICCGWADTTTVLDGFTITAGYASGGYLSANSSGGGMYNNTGSPTLINCTFIGNAAVRDGGGMFNNCESTPMLTNCIFTGNSADRDGGGMFNTEQSNPILTSCTFMGNSAIYDGGAICNRTSSPTVTNCEFTDNSANHGGGISNWPGDPSVINCTFAGNSAELGGAVFNAESSPEMINCLFSGNSAREWGGAVGNYNGSSPLLTNCILWNNKPEQIYVGSDDSAWVTYSDVQGGWPGPGNFDADPCFVELGNLDLLAYFKFDEADGTTAYDSIGINHGIVHGARWTSGKINGALDFDGYSDYVEVPAITNPINMTYMLWVRAHSHNGMWNTLIEFANDSPWFGILSTGHVELYSFVTSAMTISLGQWYHLAVTSDGHASIIYINGNQTSNAEMPNTRAGTGLGIGYHSGDTHFDGLIDDVMIFKKALTAAEIKQHYENGMSGLDYPDVNKPDYHLLPDSPCINTGDPNYIAGPNETDLEGKPRVIGGRIDMGPYEFNHIPVADAGQDRTVEAQAHWGATVTLDGSASSDADSTPGTTDDIKEFNWFEIDPCDPNADVFLGTGCIVDCNLTFGDHIIVLDVIDRAGAYDSNEVTIIVQDTTPPEFTNTPQDLAVECDGGYNLDQLNAWLACATAVDKCSDVTITNDFMGIVNSCGATGSTIVTWTAEDKYGNKATTPPAAFTIVDIIPPLIACPPDVTLEYPADTSVEANGSATAGDTCGSTTITHNDVWQPGCGNTKTIERTWIATDDCNNSSSCTQVIKVVDTTPPQFEFSVSPTTLWPPSHKMVEITPSWTVSDECDPQPQISLVKIVMSEDENAVGDGHTTGDIEVGEGGQIYVRSERSGANSGRIYTITYQAVDDCGNVTLRSATVSIPHDFKVFARIADRWLLSGREGSIQVDFNSDGIVNLADFARFAENWIK